jgi:C4-dicarboxylate-specific signal transduction histidine kinase
VFATDADWKVKIWNPALQEISGYSQDEVLGMPISNLQEGGLGTDLLNENQLKKDLLCDVMTKSGKPVHLVVSQIRAESCETDFLPTDENSSSPSGGAFYFIAQNLGGLKEAQAKLIHASRLAALGEMASSFAHELNQPLNVIALAAGNLLERAKTEDLSKDLVAVKAERIQSQALRAGKIIHGIRSFVLKIGDEEITEFDPFEQSQTAMELIREQLRIENILVDINPPSVQIKIQGRPILFEQAMLNLLANAKQAMQDAAIFEKKISISFILQDGDLTILVSDTGPGIPKGLSERIFDPFFSTKKDEGGSGIGLYMSRSIIKEMGGTIKATDVVSGACFEIRFSNVATASLGGGCQEK